MLIEGPSFHRFGLAIGLISTVLPGGIAGEGLGRMTGIELVEVPPGLNEEGADEGGGEGPGGEELGGLPGPRAPAARSALYPSPEPATDQLPYVALLAALPPSAPD